MRGTRVQFSTEYADTFLSLYLWQTCFSAGASQQFGPSDSLTLISLVFVAF